LLQHLERYAGAVDVDRDVVEFARARHVRVPRADDADSVVAVH
jgi:hypothetical protein